MLKVRYPFCLEIKVKINRFTRRSPAQCQRGATLFEMLLMAPLVFCLVLVAVDLGALLWVTLTMQSSLHAGAQFARVPTAAPANPSRYRALIASIQQHAPGLYDRVSPSYTVTLNGVAHRYNDRASYRPEMFGKSGDQVELALDGSWPLLTPLARPFFIDGLYRFSVLERWRNP